MTKALRYLLSSVLLAGTLISPGLESTQAQDDPVAALIASMSTREKVGQLILVSFYGNDTGSNSDIARLIQEYRIGGVVLSPEKGNFSNDENAAEQVRRLTQELQRLALQNPVAISPTAVPTASSTQSAVELVGSVGDTVGPAATAQPVEVAVNPVPLFIGLQQDGDGYPYTSLREGVTPLPSAMSIGATWDTQNAYSVGAVVGSELASLGVNMLLGPSLDVLERPQPEVLGDTGVRSFGGDGYWVGRMGQAYVSGVHEGSAGRVITVAKQFPGLGSSDRRASEEVATIQKSLQELRTIELAPFFAVTAHDDEMAAAVTDAMMTSPVIRYRGFQGNIRQLTRPIGLDSDGMAALMAQAELAPWRESGLLVSGPLGLPAVRRFYDPQLLTFPHKRIAQEALLAGNDLLYLCDFALEDDWASQLANIEDTIRFLADRYDNDATYRTRVDAALVRILRQKIALYPGFDADLVLTLPDAPDAAANAAAVMAVAQDSLTLIYPGTEELADRLPSPPLRDESILIFTDSRTAKDCADCAEFEELPKTALQDEILRLYGPSGSAQVVAANIHSSTFQALTELIEAQVAGEALDAAQQRLSEWLDEADWVVFLMLDIDTVTDPYSGAVKLFLKQRTDWLRDKRLVVFALNAPYYLDTTEVSKLTAYYALYSKTEPFIETAARALFRELPAKGTLPVDVGAINYDLFTSLEPDPNQVVQVSIVSPEGEAGTQAPALQVGSTLTVRTSVVLDCNGNPVPDGTPVTFRLYYASESIELPRQAVTTVDGIAETSVTLDRGGQLEISALTSSNSASTTLVLSIQGNEPGTIATIVPPTSTPTPTDTPTPTPTTTPTPSATATAAAEPTATTTPLVAGEGRSWGAAGNGLLWGLLGSLGGDVLTNVTLGGRLRRRVMRLRLVLLSLVFGLVAYCAHALGYVHLDLLSRLSLPAATALVSGAAAFVAGLGFLRAR